jgi:hypothetical protein
LITILETQVTDSTAPELTARQAETVERTERTYLLCNDITEGVRNNIRNTLILEEHLDEPLDLIRLWYEAHPSAIIVVHTARLDRLCLLEVRQLEVETQDGPDGEPVP